MHEQDQQVVALAAAMQALTGVVEIARRGQVDPALVNTCQQGLIRPYQRDLALLYGGLRQLRPGLLTLSEQLSQPKDIELTRYFVAVMQLEANLRKQPRRVEALGADLEHARRQAAFFDGLASGSTQAALARMYSEHISPLRPRIMVQGNRGHLERPQNAEQIRALLLAAVRGISLWRQHGGRRRDLLFRRRRVLARVQALLNEA
jgi:high frequency lysogenization protein